MKEYKVYLVAFKNQKLNLTVQASSIHIASEIAINRARTKKDADWQVSMIWYTFNKETL